MIRGMSRQFLHQELYHALGSLSSSHHCPCSCSRHDGIPGILMTRRGPGSLQVQESQDEPLFLWCGRMCSQKRRNKYPKLQTDHQGEELCKNDLCRYLLTSTSDIAGAVAPTFLSPWWCLPWASSDSQLEHCRRLQACWKNHHLKTPSASLRWAQGFKINLWVPWRRHHHNHQWSSKGTALLHILPSSFCKTTVFSKASQTKWLLWGYFLWICLSGHQGPWVSKAMYFWASLSLTEPTMWCVIMLCNNM